MSRRRFSPDERAALWGAWKKGLTLSEIGRGLRRWVAQHLQRDWSPRQIAVGLQRTFPHDGSMRVSHETIYRSLFVQTRNVLKKELLGHLRRGGFMRRPRAQAERLPTIVDGV